MIYLVFPVYNEGEAVAKLIDDTVFHMTEGNLPYTIVVVNDASTDNTHHIIERYKSEYPLIYINNEINLNYGGSIWRGFQYVLEHLLENDIVVTMDGDNTHNPGLILKMVRLIREGNDVVIASRYHKGGTVVGYGLIKRIISRIGNIIYRVVLPIRRVKDYTSGFRAYRGSTLLRLHKIYGDKIIERKDFTSVVEILVKLRRLKSVFFQEISFIYRYDKKEEPSKMNLKTNTVAHLLLVMDIINNRFRTLKKGLD